MWKVRKMFEKLTQARDCLNARVAWTVMGLGIVAYEAICPAGELLSEGCARAIDKHPWIVRAAIGTVGLHLSGMLPEKIDPLHQFAKSINLKSVVKPSHDFESA